MLGRFYRNQTCSAARTLEIVGERWSLLILRDALFRGITRFSDFERSLGIATNILSKRLEDLVEAGILERLLNHEMEESRDYSPTEKGFDLKPIILALTVWGDRWAAPDGPPVSFQHADCGGQVALQTHCAKCDSSPRAAEILAVPNRFS